MSTPIPTSDTAAPGTPPFNTDPPTIITEEDLGHATTAVHFLTNPSHASTVSIKKEIETLTYYDNAPKKLSFIPWPHTADGTATDILHITKNQPNSVAIFIDKRSLEDKTVIIADAIRALELESEEKDPPREKMDVIGVKYGRIPGRDALINWISLDVANGTLEELIVDGYPVIVRDPSAMDVTKERLNATVALQVGNDERGGKDVVDVADGVWTC